MSQRESVPDLAHRTNTAQGKHCASGMFGIINPTDKFSGEAYAGLVSAAGDKPAGEPASKPFGGALVENSGEGETASETAPAATGAFTTSVDEPGNDEAVPTAADVPGSIETAEEEGAGALMAAPLVGCVVAAGLTLVLA